MYYQVNKIIIIVVLICVMVQNFNCVVLNDMGIAPGFEDGTVAAGRISEAAITIDLINVTNGRQASFISGFADLLAGIDHYATYKSSDIDECIKNIYSIGLLITGGLASALCEIKVVDY